MKTYEIVTSEFLVHNKRDKYEFFKKAFLLTDTNVNVVLRMAFLFFSNANLQFSIREPIKKIYTASETILIVRQVKLIDKQKFAKMALDEISKTFVIYVVTIKISSRITIHIFQAH